jgi:Domain of unknown function (DUF4234)
LLVVAHGFAGFVFKVSSRALWSEHPTEGISHGLSLQLAARLAHSAGGLDTAFRLAAGSVLAAVTRRMATVRRGCGARLRRAVLRISDGRISDGGVPTGRLPQHSATDVRTGLRPARRCRLLARQLVGGATDSVAIPTDSHSGATRQGPSPAAVLGLSIITLGIYYLVWYGMINGEIRRHDPAIKVRPGLAVLALFLPIFNIVSAYSTAARIRQMQLDAGQQQTISPVVALLLIIFLGFGYPLYVASQLREFWHGQRRAGH